jgi:hypothetical protein
MKYLILVVALLLTAVATPADQILAGHLTGIPNEIIDYNLTAQTTFNSGFGASSKHSQWDFAIFTSQRRPVFHLEHIEQYVPLPTRRNHDNAGVRSLRR